MPFLPQRRSLKGLRAVFGEGPRKARVMLVGEVPGDCEDREGRPFVGPAGRELDNALEDACIDRAGAYVTNVVKHFKFEERGKRRIHQRPDAGAIKACRPWFDAELDVVGPEAIVILGATAGKALARQRVPARRAARPGRSSATSHGSYRGRGKGQRCRPGRDAG